MANDIKKYPIQKNIYPNNNIMKRIVLLQSYNLKQIKSAILNKDNT